MNPRNGGDPPRPSAAPFFVLLLLAVALAGCSSSQDAWGSAVGSDGADPGRSVDGDDEIATDGGAVGVDGSEVSLAEDDLIFRDPGATGEYAPVEEEPALDLSPEALPPVVEPQLPEQTDVLASVVDDLAAVPGDTDVEVLDRVEPIDEGPSETGRLSERDGHRRNEVGELLVLDDEASLACSAVERALPAIDEGDRTTGAALVSQASAGLDRSPDGPMAGWSTILTDSFDTDAESAALVGFLTVCIEGGYEL